MPTDELPVRPARTVLAAVAGGAVGAAVVGYLSGQAVSLLGSGESGAWAGLAAAIVGAALGAFLGAAVALAAAFSDEPTRARRTTALTTLLGGPVLLAGIAAGASRLEHDWNVPPLWLALAVPVAALAGRWLATRHGGG